MKEFQSTECAWQNFSVRYERNFKILCGKDGICKAFLIPFNNDIPVQIERKLNEILLKSMNELPEEYRKNPNACNLKVWLKVDFSQEKTQHYLIINVSGATSFCKNVLIKPQNENEYDYLYDEFVSYCKERLLSLIWNGKTMLFKEYIDINIL